MKTWYDIEPAEAEAQLRGLTRRLAEMDEVMKDAQRMAADYPGSFSAKLSLLSLSQLQDRLQAERIELVKHRKYEVLNVALNGIDFAHHTAGLSQLGHFLVRLQSLYQSIGQAITTGPRLRGPISNEIMRSTQLRFANVFPSSFGMEMFVASGFDATGESTAVSSLQTLFNLLTATNRESETARLSAEIGQRAVQHLRKVLADLHRASAGFSLNWIDSAGVQFTWVASSDDIPRLQANVSRFQERPLGENVFDGWLAGASLLRNRFEFLTVDKTTIEGRITGAIKPKLSEFFGRRCKVTLDQVDIVETHSGDSKTYSTLVGIEPHQVVNPAITGTV